MLLLQFFALILSILPAKLIEFFCLILAFLFYDVFKLRKNLVDQNIARAYGSTTTIIERRRMARRSYQSAALILFEFVLGSLKNPSKSVTVKNAGKVKNLIQEGRGIYYLGIHMSNFEVMGAAINTFIGPAHTVVKKVGPPAIDNLVVKIRERNGFRVIKKGVKGAAFKKLLEALGRGESVGYVADQARPGEPKLDFFGTPASTNTTLGRMWLRHRAPIVPTMTVRTKFGHHELRFFDELDTSFVTDEMSDTDIGLELARRANKISEMLVRQCPEQYFWFHNRWK